MNTKAPAVERSCVPPFLLPRSLSEPQPPVCETRSGPLQTVCSHSTSGADQRPPEAQASGPINNHSAELQVRQQSADEPVSTKHQSFPLPPLHYNSHF